MGPKHKYNIPNLLASIIGYKGVPFPGLFFPPRTAGAYEGQEFDATSEAPARQELVKGTVLRKEDHRGIWYFMPVYFRHKDITGDSDNTLELQNAVISVTGSKSIVETQMVGRRGTVKELISIDDFKVSITAFIQSDDGTYPDEEIERIKGLFAVNESVEIISALTDLLLDEGDRVVIEEIEFPATPGIEDGQAVRLECITDQEFELIIP